MLMFMRLMLALAILLSIHWEMLAADPQMLFKQAVEAQQAGQLEQAVTLYRQLVAAAPNFIEAHANLGAALVQLGRFDQAIEEYQSALRLDASNTAIKRNLALAFYKRNNFAAAIPIFRDLAQIAPGDVQLAALLGYCYLQSAQFKEAAQAVEAAAQIHPENLDLAYILGTAYARGGRKADGAALLERVGEAGHSAEAYAAAGSARLDLDSYEQARKDFDAAGNLNPGLPGLHTLLGIASDKLGDTDRAIVELRQGLAANPKDFEANLYLGSALYKNRDLSEAKLYLDRALDLSPTSALARYQSALLKAATGDNAGAAGDLEALSKADPLWLEPHVQLSALYMKLHRKEDAARERAAVEHLSAQAQSRPN